MTAATQPPPQPTERIAVRPPAQGIWGDAIGPLLQNIIGGYLGAGLITLALAVAAQAVAAYWAEMDFDAHLAAEQALPAAVWVGTVATGLAMLARAFWDEVATGIRLWADRRNAADHEELLATVATQEAQIARLRTELEEARTAGTPDHSLTAWATARQILADYYTSKDSPDPAVVKRYSPSRAACAARGIRPRDWRLATPLMQRAGIVDRAGTIRPATYVEALDLLIQAMESSKRMIVTKDGGLART